MSAELEHLKIDTDAFHGTVIKVSCKSCSWEADRIFLQVPGGVELAELAKNEHNTRHDQSFSEAKEEDS